MIFARADAVLRENRLRWVWHHISCGRVERSRGQSGSLPILRCPSDEICQKRNFRGEMWILRRGIFDRLGRGSSARCPNHPDRLTARTCSDCGGSFCEDCLANYELKGKGGESAILSLCPDCLRSRYSDRADRAILGSVFFFLFGIFVACIAFTTRMEMLALAFFSFAIGTAGLIYGFSLRKSAGSMVLPNQLSAENTT